MIIRIWRGWTSLELAEDYEKLLRQEVFPGIAAKAIAGYLGVELFRLQPEGDEVEFMTIMRFASLDAVKEFVGADYAWAYVPPAAREILSRFDERSRHYELRHQMDA